MIEGYRLEVPPRPYLKRAISEKESVVREAISDWMDKYAYGLRGKATGMSPSDLEWVDSVFAEKPPIEYADFEVIE